MVFTLGKDICKLKHLIKNIFSKRIHLLQVFTIFNKFICLKLLIFLALTICIWKFFTQFFIIFGPLLYFPSQTEHDIFEYRFQDTIAFSKGQTASTFLMIYFASGPDFLDKNFDIYFFKCFCWGVLLYILKEGIFFLIWRLFEDVWVCYLLQAFPCTLAINRLSFAIYWVKQFLPSVCIGSMNNNHEQTARCLRLKHLKCLSIFLVYCWMQWWQTLQSHLWFDFLNW